MTTTPETSERVRTATEVAAGPDTSPGLPGQRRRPLVGRLLFWVVMVLLSLVFIGPLAWMLLTAFKSGVESRTVPPTALTTFGLSGSGFARTSSRGLPVTTWAISAACQRALKARIQAAAAAAARHSRSDRGCPRTSS